MYVHGAAFLVQLWVVSYKKLQEVTKTRMCVVPYLASLMCRDGDTFLTAAEGSRLSRNNSILDHANMPHECSLEQCPSGKSHACPSGSVLS